MKKIISTIMCGTLMAGLSVASLAKTPTINKREYKQQERIRQGIRSGELTRREAGRLEAEQAKIKTDEALAKADGKVTPKERTRLNRELNHSSRDIYRQKHDKQDRK